MSFKDIVGQSDAIGLLREAMGRERIPSAYLFLGPRNVGKRTTALTLAKALNCREAAGDSCDACPSCRKIDEKVHPDVETVSPDGQFIKIDQVREVTNRLALIPFEATKRVIVFSAAGRMNPQAANALLKTLEEPPQNTLLVLCAERAAGLLETIVSRCVPVRFGLLGQSDTRALLESAAKLDAQLLDFSIRFSQGRLRPELPSRAQQWMEIRDEMIKGMEGLNRPVFTQLSQQMARWGSNEDWRFVLEWLESWFRDLVFLAEGIDPAKLINNDRVEEMRNCAEWFNAERAQRCYRRVLDTRDAIAINANKTLALEALWLGFKHEIRQARTGA
ncbi:MAG: DNA polymerase III subunit delta' [bacterium]